jgi:hypothetical protein
MFQIFLYLYNTLIHLKDDKNLENSSVTDEAIKIIFY